MYVYLEQFFVAINSSCIVYVEATRSRSRPRVRAYGVCIDRLCKSACASHRTIRPSGASCASRGFTKSEPPTPCLRRRFSCALCAARWRLAIPPPPLLSPLPPSPTHQLIDCWQGHKQTGEQLLKCGANIDAVSSRGATALFMSGFYGHIETTFLLLAWGE